MQCFEITCWTCRKEMGQINKLTYNKDFYYVTIIDASNPHDSDFFRNQCAKCHSNTEEESKKTYDKKMNLYKNYENLVSKKEKSNTYIELSKQIIESENNKTFRIIVEGNPKFSFDKLKKYLKKMIKHESNMDVSRHMTIVKSNDDFCYELNEWYKICKLTPTEEALRTRIMK